MSLLNRISNGYKNSSIMESITDQIAVLFSNRTDVYWAYDAYEKKIVGLHEIFKMDMLSSDFLGVLAKGIELFEPRVKNVVCNWSLGEESLLNICFLLKHNLKSSNLTVSLKDL